MQILLDPISLIVLAMYAGLMVWEFFFPARELPKVKFWKIKGIASFVVFFYLSSYMPMFTDPYLQAYQLFDLSYLSIDLSHLPFIISCGYFFQTRIKPSMNYYILYW